MTIIDQEKRALLERRTKALAEKKRRDELPHIYFPRYKWQDEFINSNHKYNFNFKANQVGGSSAQIMKLIHFATEPEVWKKQWGKRPNYFFYFYPSRDTAKTEIENKWVNEWLPRGEMKSDPKYGWDFEYDGKWVYAVHFKSGVSCYIKSYGSDVHAAMQANTPEAIFCDEELPMHLWPELNTRLVAVQGALWCMTATPTIGQDFWREVYEGKRLEQAYRVIVTMYDCLVKMDGSPGHLTKERIEEYKQSLGSDTEIATRVYGKFQRSDGLLVPCFDFDKHFTPGGELPKDWYCYSGIDPGGGGTSHPGGIIILAVSPLMNRARVFKLWRGNKNETTTAADILDKYKKMRRGLPMIGEFYDFAAKDFGTLASRAGIPIQKANKTRDDSFVMINALFREGMLTIDDEPNNLLLVEELQGNFEGQNKRHAKDELIDALRYAIMGVNWNFQRLLDPVHIPLEDIPPEGSGAHRLYQMQLAHKEAEKDNSVEEEINFWSEMYEENYD